MSKKDLERRLDALMKRARVRSVPMLEIVDIVADWPTEASMAYRVAASVGDEAECVRIYELYHGPMPDVGDLDGIIAIIVCPQIPMSTLSEPD